MARVVDSATVNAGELRDHLLALSTDPEVAARSARLRHTVRAEGGVARAAGLIEKMVG